MHLQPWMVNCNMQIVLDEEQDIIYLVKYAPNPEKRPSNMNNLLCSLLPQLHNQTEQQTIEEEIKENEQPPPAESTTLTQRLTIRTVRERYIT